jgi:excisionase family DNA binding protein
MKVTDEIVYTLEEVGKYLKVPVDTLKQEIAAGRLDAMNIGGFIRIREFALAEYKNVASNAATVGGGALLDNAKWLRLMAGDNFEHIWPDDKQELFWHAKEGTASYTGREYQVKLGFTVRESAGRPRVRCLIMIDRYPTVEFVKADDNDEVGLMASIIKDRFGKQLPPSASPPQEYAGLQIGGYRDVVDGRGAPNGLAVICSSDDFETMVKHALIRYRFREERPKKN